MSRRNNGDLIGNGKGLFQYKKLRITPNSLQLQFAQKLEQIEATLPGFAPPALRHADELGSNERFRAALESSPNLAVKEA